MKSQRGRPRCDHVLAIRTIKVLCGSRGPIGPLFVHSMGAAVTVGVMRSWSGMSWCGYRKRESSDGNTGNAVWDIFGCEKITDD
jgi:hypothetical protein